LNVGVLPVQVSEEFLNHIFTAIEEDPKAEIQVDLEKQVVSLVGKDLEETFEINGYKKGNMLNGFDDIDYLQQMKSEIEQFESQRPF